MLQVLVSERLLVSSRVRTATMAVNVTRWIFVAAVLTVAVAAWFTSVNSYRNTRTRKKKAPGYGACWRIAAAG
jgi:hypothetical protein